LYAKLFTSIYQGTLRGNSHGLLVFTNLLAHCDKDGIADIHPRAVAEEVGLTVEQVRAAIEELESPDDESRSPEEQGRRIVRMDDHRAWGWRVVNYVKYRAIRNEEDRREQNRRAQEAWRKKHKPPSAEVSRDKPPSAEVSQAKPQSAHTEADTEAEAKAKNKREARERAAPVARPADVSEAVWSDWKALRKAKRAPVTPTVLAEAEREAAKAGMPLQEFLSVWCARGSQGLQAEWLHSNEKRNGQHAETNYARQMREKYEQVCPDIAAKRPGAELPFTVDMENPNAATRRLG